MIIIKLIMGFNRSVGRIRRGWTDNIKGDLKE